MDRHIAAAYVGNLARRVATQGDRVTLMTEAEFKASPMGKWSITRYPVMIPLEFATAGWRGTAEASPFGTNQAYELAGIDPQPTF